MFQTHCYDAWLDDSARRSTFYVWSQLGGTFPAPLFLFLAGISIAIATDKLHRKGHSRSQIARTTIGRGAGILSLGILFRIQEFAISLGWAPWQDLFRLDILNEIGVSIMLLGILCWILGLSTGTDRDKWLVGSGAAACALTISLLSPLIWTSWSPNWLPWPLESYINGVHNLGKPQPWLFPIFPWAAFAFAGLATGFVLLTDWAGRAGSKLYLGAIPCGVGLIFFGRWIEDQPLHIYASNDFWHTSPAFFLIRAGFLLVFLGVAYIWCRWGLGGRGFSPLIQLGQTSLLVYWVHIEFVYGRFTILSHHGENIRKSSLGLLVIFLSMLLLSILRTHFKRPSTKAQHRSLAASALNAPSFRISTGGSPFRQAVG
jgi:uncharacterized membrane protein